MDNGQQLWQKYRYINQTKFKKLFYRNIKRYVNQIKFGVLDVNLSRANKCHV